MRRCSKKECGRYFGTTIYLLNTGIGAVMLLGFSVYVLFVRGQAALLVAQMGGVQAVAPMLAAVVCLMQATVNPACVSISLEGRTLWILKEAPVPPRELFGAKALVNVLVSDVPATLMRASAVVWAGPVRAGRIGAAGTVCVHGTVHSGGGAGRQPVAAASGL